MKHFEESQPKAPGVGKPKTRIEVNIKPFFRASYRAIAATAVNLWGIYGIHKIAKLQEHEREKAERDPTYTPKVRTAIITARNAPSHERMITTLQEWGILVDETFFLGGVAIWARRGVAKPTEIQGRHRVLVQDARLCCRAAAFRH